MALPACCLLAACLLPACCLPAACLLPRKPPAVPCRLPIDHARAAVSTTMPCIAPTAARRCPGPPLNTAGFDHYEVSNYALPGHRCRHNMAYWQGASFYGLGLGSASFLQASIERCAAPAPAAAAAAAAVPVTASGCCCPRSAAAGAATWAAVPPPIASPANCYPPPPSPCRAVGSAGPSG